MNRREWVLYGQKELEEAQIENASGDAWYLFSECFHISREAATCGTINMDYRSLYLHFENGAFLYNCDAVKEMRKDFEHIFAESTEVTEKYKSGRSAVLRGTQCLLRLFAPLM